MMYYYTFNSMIKMAVSKPKILQVLFKVSSSGDEIFMYDHMKNYMTMLFKI
ncbi:hypothetical protein EMUR_04050 [Ehrlichia muris AS145]|uniref:Uncharacterized protein n=1 Tax=Ehrlichia muris AS145 TaxID=1423892 RepID=V9R7J8_9RICK|nr:hypothetical protein EMUR_04050 [Ehrlichia muris AS145]